MSRKMSPTEIEQRAEYVREHIANPKALLGNIEVLYRQPHGAPDLWGIPYPAQPRRGPRRFATRIATGWIWLGGPGDWWGDYTKKEIQSIRKFLKEVGALVPERPGDWVRREDWEAEPSRFRIVARLPGEEWDDPFSAGFSSVTEAAAHIKQGILRANKELYLFPDPDDEVPDLRAIRPTEMFWGVVPVTPDWEWDPDQVEVVYAPATENPGWDTTSGITTQTIGQIERYRLFPVPKPAKTGRLTKTQRQVLSMFRGGMYVEFVHSLLDADELLHLKKREKSALVALLLGGFLKIAEDYVRGRPVLRVEPVEQPGGERNPQVNPQVNPQGTRKLKRSQ